MRLDYENVFEVLKEMTSSFPSKSVSGDGVCWGATLGQEIGDKAGVWYRRPLVVNGKQSTWTQRFCLQGT